MARRRPRRLTPSYLRNVVRWYLERWDAPSAHLHRRLMERARRAVAEHDQDLEDCRRMVDDAVAWAVEIGLVDDARYAAATVQRQRASGKSRRQIQAALRAKGVASALIDAAIAEHADDEEGDPERLAAIRYARRRGFGPFRRPTARAFDPDDKRRKELASMARAGFSYTLAKTVLDAEDAMALEDELPRGW